MKKEINNEEVKTKEVKKTPVKKASVPKEKTLDEKELIEKKLEEIQKEHAKAKRVKKDSVLTSDVKDNFNRAIDYIKEKFNDFMKLDLSMKTIIIVPIVILIIILGNSVWSNSQTTNMKCSYQSISSTIKINQDIELVFRKDKIYTQTTTTKYEIVSTGRKTLSSIEEEKKTSNETLNDIKGVSAKYKIENKVLINTIKYNYYKISKADINELGLDSEGTLETYKNRYEGFGYKCN